MLSRGSFLTCSRLYSTYGSTCSLNQLALLSTLRMAESSPRLPLPVQFSLLTDSAWSLLTDSVLSLRMESTLSLLTDSAFSDMLRLVTFSWLFQYSNFRILVSSSLFSLRREETACFEEPSSEDSSLTMLSSFESRICSQSSPIGGEGAWKRGGGSEGKAEESSLAVLPFLICSSLYLGLNILTTYNDFDIATASPFLPDPYLPFLIRGGSFPPLNMFKQFLLVGLAGGRWLINR